MGARHADSNETRALLPGHSRSTDTPHPQLCGLPVLLAHAPPLPVALHTLDEHVEVLVILANQIGGHAHVSPGI